MAYDWLNFRGPWRRQKTGQKDLEKRQMNVRSGTVFVDFILCNNVNPETHSVKLSTELPNSQSNSAFSHQSPCCLPLHSSYSELMNGSGIKS